MKKIFVDPYTLEGEAREIAMRIIKKDKESGKFILKSSRPKLADMDKVNDKSRFIGHKWIYRNADDRQQGEAAYVWRNIVFFVSDEGRHQCMPVMETAYIDDSYPNKRDRMKELDLIVDQIMEQIPASQWQGVRRWGRALGYS